MPECSSEHPNLLLNNRLKEFLLKINFAEGLTIDGLSTAIEGDYIRKEVHEISSVNVQVRTQNGQMEASACEAPKRDQYVFVLGDKANLVFLPVEQVLEIHTNVYRDNTIYKSLIQKISEAFPECVARRIGLRYINIFDCARVSGLSSVLKAPYSGMVKSLLHEDSATRAVCVTSWMLENGSACNVQFGVPNECFPRHRVNCNVLLDIESYVQGEVIGRDWPMRIRELNHAAYDRFRSYVTDRQIAKMV